MPVNASELCDRYADPLEATDKAKRGACSFISVLWCARGRIDTGDCKPSNGVLCCRLQDHHCKKTNDNEQPSNPPASDVLVHSGIKYSRAQEFSRQARSPHCPEVPGFGFEFLGDTSVNFTASLFALVQHQMRSAQAVLFGGFFCLSVMIAGAHPQNLCDPPEAGCSDFGVLVVLRLCHA